MIGVALRNPQFRRLWLSQVVSQAGDWLGRMAVLTLIATVGGPSEAAGVGALFAFELATRLLPTTVMASLSGPVADRMPRKLLMVTADLLRAGIVLAFLLVREPGDLPLLYCLLVAQMGLAPFFEAARSASVPNTLPREELHEAYTLNAATWSTMLSVGAVAGGLLVDVIGVRGVFLVDAATYVVSALLLIGVKLPPVPEHPEPFRWRDVFLFTDIRRGLAHVHGLGLTCAIFAKTFWGGAGGFLVLISIVAKERFTPTDAAAMGMGSAVGFLFGARGIGTGIGPILARRFHGSSTPRLMLQVSAGFFLAAAGYAVFAVAPSLPLAFACVVFAHAGGSTLWVASTTLWQRRVEDAFRGRLFAAEFLGMTLGFSLAGFVAGFLYDATGSIETTVWATCVLVVVCGTCWSVWARKSGAGREPDSALVSSRD